MENQDAAADAIYFESPAAFRAWLEEHHATAREVWVGYYKKGTGLPSMTWPESVDEALCFGWIDGIRKGVDEQRYRIRFTPRKPTSIWSAVNVGRVAELAAAGRMRPAGMRAFEARRDDRTAIYGYEQRQSAALDAAQEAQLRASAAAWSFWEAQPPGYRRTATWWVVSARKAETRQKRLERLIADSAAGRPVRELVRPGAAPPADDRRSDEAG